jgi:peptidoglycan/xylan/chitin deacetylase (PgdA/CDA1 family)
MSTFNDTAAPPGAPPTTRPREVAITFDDLPAQPPLLDNDSLREITERLLEAIRAHDVPALGFVNEGAFYDGGEVDEGRLALLKMWADAGLELGNHTFSHPDLNDTPLAAYLDDIVRGEALTRALLEERGGGLRYFRHPYLHTGLDAETKVAVEQFLGERGYAAVPVTLYNQEWAFAKVYDRAWVLGDEGLMRRVADAYVPYMEKIFEFFERLSVELLGYEVRQVLLLHASALNAHHFDALARMMKRRGYTFVPAARALDDPAYLLPDTFTGPRGRSALHRWAASMGREMRREPAEPGFVTRLYEESCGPQPSPAGASAPAETMSP